MNTGKIKWFNPTKGFGFIETGEEGKDLFLHISALQEANIDQITEGEAVSYENNSFRNDMDMHMDITYDT